MSNWVFVFVKNFHHEVDIWISVYIQFTILQQIFLFCLSYKTYWFLWSFWCVMFRFSSKISFWKQLLTKYEAALFTSHIHQYKGKPYPIHCNLVTSSKRVFRSMLLSYIFIIYTDYYLSFSFSWQSKVLIDALHLFRVVMLNMMHI